MPSNTDTGHTTYSLEFPGDKCNHNWGAVLDLTDGYLGIVQDQGEPNGLQRVLLSPKQVKALVKFLEDNAAS